MRGRYDLSTNPAAIRAKFGVPEDAMPAFALNSDVWSTQYYPIVRRTIAGGRQCVLYAGAWSRRGPRI